MMSTMTKKMMTSMNTKMMTMMTSIRAASVRIVFVKSVQSTMTAMIVQ